MEQPIESRKKLGEMTPEERRKYDRESKRKSRERQKQERLARQIPVGSDYQLPRSQQDQLAENAAQITSTIAAELPEKLTFEDERMVEMMADVLLGHEKDWTQQVYSPNGFLYGRYHPDAAASDLIAHLHRFPTLLESKTFNMLDQKFLKLVRKLSKNEWFDRKFAQQIETEIQRRENDRTSKA